MLVLLVRMQRKRDRKVVEYFEIIEKDEENLFSNIIGDLREKEND